MKKNVVCECVQAVLGWQGLWNEIVIELFSLVLHKGYSCKVTALLYGIINFQNKGP